MKGYKVAGRYAQSLLEITEDKGVTKEVVRDMEFLIKAVAESRDFMVFLNSPIINPNRKNDILDKVFEDFQELTLGFIHLITKNRREMLLPLIAEQFIAKVKEVNGIVPVTVTSAVKMEEGLRNQILSKLKQGIDGTIEIEEKVDPKLLGGFVVRMGDIRVDASVAHQLNELKQRLTR
ncbi:MAG: ATP synthase F1 subunit delta [Brumimicrobium sp.]|nr:ATP synthase F1 subunit delta [Brumimicrobium sp.]